MTIIVMSVLFAGLGLTMAEFQLIKASDIEVLTVYCVLGFVFCIIAVLYNLTRHFYTGNEGFFFMGALFVKMILIILLLLTLVKFQKLENHSLLFLFLFSYFVFSIFDIKYKVQLLKD